jgi:hypothetical protein
MAGLRAGRFFRWRKFSPVVRRKFSPVVIKNVEREAYALLFRFHRRRDDDSAERWALVRRESLRAVNGELGVLCELVLVRVRVWSLNLWRRLIVLGKIGEAEHKIFQHFLRELPARRTRIGDRALGDLRCDQLLLNRCPVWAAFLPAAPPFSGLCSTA